ncbi:MAG: hypothetical protein ACYTF9_14215 [Planctomycetota bacterium]|jgi:DNA-directed RNA polymerase subunit RPC12/RpoP
MDSPILTLLWASLCAASIVIGLMILARRGLRGIAFSIVVVIGAGASYPLFHPSAFPGSWTLAALGALAAAAGCCLALRRPRVSTATCWNCGYDFQGSTEESSAKCTECGVPRAAMRDRCLECKADISQAIAGGSDTCKSCGARIPVLPHRLEHTRLRK